MAGFELQVAGDPMAGYHVVILHNGRKVARHNHGGEFSVVFENGDRSIRCAIDNWRAQAWTGFSKQIDLMGKVRIEELETDVSVTVRYSVVNESVISKRISISQSNASFLYYSINNRLETIEEPKSYWSFGQQNCSRGAVYDVFPAAALQLEDGQTIGLLTDSGYRNQWTKNYRRRSLSGGLIGLEMIPDVDLLRIEDGAVELNFGQLNNYLYGDTQPVKVADCKSFAPWRGGQLVQDEHHSAGFAIKGNARGCDLSGVLVPLEVKKGSFYRVSFRYRSDFPSLGIELLDSNHTEGLAFNLKDYSISAQKSEWKTVTRTFLINRDTGPAYLYVGKGMEEEREHGNYEIEIADFRIVEVTPKKECYHRIEAAKPIEKNLFIYVTSATTHGDLRKDSQIALAEGLGCQGTDFEKIMYANRQMLMWIAEPGDFSPHSVPSLGYSPDMYFRDSFWTVVAGYDKELNEEILQKWVVSQDDAGCVRTIWSPYVGDQENSPNESTMLFIVWSYLNKKRFGTDIDLVAVEKALDYIRRIFDPDQDGRVMAPTPAWMDMIWPVGGAQFSVMQGIYANALRCAQALGCSVTNEEIEKAKEGYRELYDPELGYLRFANKDYRFGDAMSPSNLMGEFLSLWLFDEAILSDEAVLNTLEKFPVLNGCVPCLVSASGEYFGTDSPFTPENRWYGGVYLNGGSWLLYEYLSYVAGLRHGWEKARERMDKRLNAELTHYKDEPFSHEHLGLKIGEDGQPIPCYHRVFGWNTFVMIANEVAGLRKPSSDPTFRVY